MMLDPVRNIIFLQDAEILSQEPHPEGQFVLRVHAPKCAATAKPGQFVHLRCDPQRQMRRPLSIMRTSPQDGWVELLYKVVGEGTSLLAKQKVGERISVMGPIGRPFQLDTTKTRALLLGGGVGIPPMLGLSELIKNEHEGIQPIVFMGSEVPFPLVTAPSKISVGGTEDEISQSIELLEQWNIPSRLASLQGYDGVYQGYITDLARAWLSSLSEEERAKVAVYTCGPTPMLKAVAALADEFRLPCQVCLEEYMACGVGGCAGCVVKVTTAEGEMMKRVCVDGPVFDAKTVFAAS